MTNYEKLKLMTIEDMAMFLYVNLSKKGLAKTKDWLNQSDKSEDKE